MDFTSEGTDLMLLASAESRIKSISDAYSLYTL